MTSLLRPTALAVLICGLTACSPQPTLEVPADYKNGQKHFHKICANCHGSDAMGGQTKAPKLIDADYLMENFSDDDIRDMVIEGSEKMPSQRAKVSDPEIVEIIKYLRYSQKTAGLAVEEDEPSEEDDSEDTEET